MAKRFTDTDIWDKEWFMLLPSRLKLTVKYLRDKANLAGVWSPNWVLLKVHIGEEVSEQDVLKIDAGRQFKKTESGKIFCEGFISFQYGGELKPKSPVHKKIMDFLDKETICGQTLLYRFQNRVLDSLKEEDKEEEAETDKEAEKDTHVIIPMTPMVVQGGIVQEMVRVFRESNKDYPVDDEADFPSARKLADKIARTLNLVDFTLQTSKRPILDYWYGMIGFMKLDEWFSGYSISMICKHFSSIIQRKNNPIQNGISTQKPAGFVKPVAEIVPEGQRGQL